MKQKKKIKRKLLSFLLTLAIAIGLVPGMNLTVHAETQVNQVDYYYNEGMTLKTISAEFYDDNSLKSFSATYEWGWGSVKQSLVLLDTLLVCDYDSYANSYARDDYGESFCNYEDSKNYVLTKNPGTNFVAESENPDNATPIVNGSNTKTLELSKGVVPSDVNKVYYLFLWTSKAPDDEVYPDYHLATVIVSGGKVYLGKENTTPSVPTHTVTFDTQNHGVAPANQSVGDGDKVTKPTDPTAEGFTFGGWYKEEGCTTAWNFESDTVTANTTLYAKWIEPAKVKTSPTPKEDLTYNGKQQELLNGGTSENGTMKYALGADSTTVPTSGWGIYIPKATNADTYYVWYKVVGDENHTDTNPVCITVDIDTKTDVSAEQKQGETLTYDGTAKTPTIDIKDGETKVSTYTVKYVGVEPTVYEESETAPTEAGNYKAVVTLNGNYSGTKEVPFTVSPKPETEITVEQKQGETLTYDGTAKTPTIDIKDGETEISTYTVKYVGVEPTVYEESETAPTEAGNYKAVITLNGNYSGTKEVPFIIDKKAAPTLTDDQKPTAKNNLSYKGEPQEIVNAPIELPDDYIGIQYAIGSETGPTGEYTTFIPEATDAGTYFVWYKLIGDENHKDTEPVYIMVTIKQVDLSIKTEVNTSEDASYIKVDNLNDDLVVKLLTDEEKRKYEVGNPVIVYLDITALDKADVPAEDMTAIEKILNSDGYSYGECLDLSLWKKLGEGVPTQIHDTNGNPIKITITIPELLKNVPEGYTRTYAVVRLHNGISTKLAEGTGATLEISTDKFSSYFIIFKDVKNSADDKKQDKSSNADTPSNVNTTATVDTPKTADTQKTDAPKTENTNKGNKISTGDKINIGVIVMLMMDSVMAGVYLTLRRKLM